MRSIGEMRLLAVIMAGPLLLFSIVILLLDFAIKTQGQRIAQIEREQSALLYALEVQLQADVSAKKTLIATSSSP